MREVFATMDANGDGNVTLEARDLRKPFQGPTTR